MKYYKFLLVMLVSSMVCFSVIAVSGNQMPVFSGQKLNVNDKAIIDNPLFSNQYEGVFKTIINHFIIIIPIFLIKIIHSQRCETLEMDSNCLETYIDSDFKEDVSEGKIESVTISNDREETIFQEFEEKVEDKDIEEIFIENEPEDDDNKQDSAEKNDDYEEEQDDNIDNNDEETEEPIDDFNLEFTLDLDEIYAHTEPIHVTAIIKNNGEKTVELCEIDVKLRSLDFEIETPAGNIIHYVGPFEGKGEALKLNPFESISYKINLTSTNVSFGDTMNGPTGLFGSYNFLPGSYTIQGIYISYQTLTAESSSYFQGVLYSPSYNFIIREGPAPN